MSYQVLARKYRPQTFDEVVGQEHITRTLQNAVTAKRIHHAYLFTGARGIGKTTVARIFAKALNCEKGPTTNPCNVCPSCVEITGGSSLDVREIDGASNTSVDDVREIREVVKYLPTRGRYKIYIIDEVHMLSTSAFNALLKTLEEPPEHVIFMFATTEPHKIPATVLSRCQRHDFKRIAIPRIVGQLEKIAAAEGINASADVLSVVAREADGSMRDAESLFDQAIAFSGKEIKLQDIQSVLGFLDRQQLMSLLEAVVAGDAKGTISVLCKFFLTGVDLSRLTYELLEQIKNLNVLKACGDIKAFADLTSVEQEALAKLVEKRSLDEFQRAFQILYRGAEDVARSKFPKMVLEVLLIQVASIEPARSIDELMERAESLARSSGGALNTGSGHGAGPGQGARSASAAPSYPPRNAATAPEKSSTRADVPVTTHAEPEMLQNNTATAPLQAGEKTWEGFMGWLKTAKPQVASILEHGTMSLFGTGMIEMTYPKGSLYGDMLNEARRREQIEGLFADFFGAPRALRVSFKGGSVDPMEARAAKKTEDSARKRQLKEEALSNETVREATKIFGAEIKEIKV